MLSGSFDDADHDDGDDRLRSSSNDGDEPPRPPKLQRTDTLIQEENTAIDLVNRAVALRRKYQRAAASEQRRAGNAPAY